MNTFDISNKKKIFFVMGESLKYSDILLFCDYDENSLISNCILHRVITGNNSI